MKLGMDVPRVPRYLLIKLCGFVKNMAAKIFLSDTIGQILNF